MEADQTEKPIPAQDLLRVGRFDLSANSTNNSTNDICTSSTSLPPLSSRNMIKNHTRDEFPPPTSRQNRILKESVARIFCFVRRNDNDFHLSQIPVLSVSCSSVFDYLHIISENPSFRFRGLQPYCHITYNPMSLPAIFLTVFPSTSATR
jgi:hypothetical protein